MSFKNINLLLKKNNFDFYYLDEVESTMLEVKKKISENNICIMANKQTKGKGRRGAEWVSPEGHVYISLLQKNTLDIKNHFLNNAYTSNIICDVIEKVCNIKTEIKWPNDILIKDQKISGIISEIYQKDNKELIITGFGINIVSSPKIENYLTTYVNKYNENINNIKFAYMLMHQYLKNNNLLKKFSNSILKKYKSRLKFLNTNIKLKLENNLTKEGLFYGLNNDGSIILHSHSKFENIYNARIITW